MGRRFLPSLRTKTAAPTGYTTQSVTPADVKAAYADYYTALAAYGAAGSSARSWGIERAVVEGYERIVWGYKAVNAIASAHASLQYRLRSGTDVVDDDPVCYLLNVRANPLETGYVFRKRLSSQVSLSKPGVFVETGRSNRGTPIRYDLLPPGRVKIVPGRNGVLIDHYELWDRGRKSRDLDPRDVRWIRDPHPTDPFSGMTPLEAAGLSIELDHFARLYNVTWLRNDGRPGGIVGVGGADEDVDDTILDAIERRFDKGPHNAGKLTAVAGQLSYVDLGSKPRDAQYGTLAHNAKTEILVAFGVAESQLGNAADRTFANAEQEGLAFWTQTMAGHNRLIVTAFEEDSPPELRGFLDTSEIEVLQVPQRARRAEALAEFNAGLRSIVSYARLAGYGDEIEDTPETRALYLPSGKTPIASREGDKKALGLDTGGSAAPGQVPAPGQAPPGEEAAAALDRHSSAAPAAAAAVERLAPTGTDTGRTAAQAVAATTPRPALPAAPASNVGASLFGKHGGPDRARAAKARPALRLVVDRPEHKGTRQPWRESETDEAHAVRLETDLGAALASLADRWTERTVARVQAPKARKGTRHFTPQYAVDTRVGTNALDAPRIVDEDRFAAEAQAVALPMLLAAAAASSTALVDDLGITEQAGVAAGPTPVLVGGLYATPSLLGADDSTGHDALSDWLWTYVKYRALRGVLDLIGASAHKAAARLADTVITIDQGGGTVTDIEAGVREWGRLADGWAHGLAMQAATAAVEATRTETAAAVLSDAEAEVVRVWKAKMDAVTRPTHRQANGQKRGVGDPFTVGDALLRWPGDPDGPVGETANCRCRLTIRSRVSGRFLPAARDTTRTRAATA